MNINNEKEIKHTKDSFSIQEINYDKNDIKSEEHQEADFQVLDERNQIQN